MKNDLIDIIVKMVIKDQFVTDTFVDNFYEVLNTRFDKYINFNNTGSVLRAYRSVIIRYKYCDTTYLDKIFINCKRTDFYYYVPLTEILSFIDEELLTTFVIENI